MDGLSDEQLAASNVIVHYTKHHETEVKDVLGAATLEIAFSGEGRAQVFRDGLMLEAKWTKPTSDAFCQYVSLDGAPVPLRPGQTWVEVVPTDYSITYGEE
jgi:hypothetical protein